MQNIIVCVKAVPEPKDACKITIDLKTKTLSRCDIPMAISMLDRHALEMALCFKEKYGSEVTVVTMGPPAAADVVKECLALGADHGYLLSDAAFGGADTLSTARTLSIGIKKIGTPDLILCGMASSDGATEWVGPQIAVMLGFPVVTSVSEFVNFTDGVCRIKAKIENGYRLIDVVLPALITATREISQPRELSFSGIMKAKKKEITIWNLQDLGIPENTVGLKGSPTIVTRLETIETKRQVEFINGSLEEKALFLVEKLKSVGVI